MSRSVVNTTTRGPIKNDTGHRLAKNQHNRTTRISRARGFRSHNCRRIEAPIFTDY